MIDLLNEYLVLHIVDNLKSGGTQTIIKGLFENNKLKVRQFLFVLRSTSEQININNDNIVLNSFKSKYAIYPLIELFKIVKQHKKIILHCHLLRSSVYGYILKCFYPHIKLIFHEHGRVFKNNVLYDLFLKLSARRVDIYIAVSGTTKKLLLSKGVPSHKIKIMNNFIDKNRISREKFSKYRNEYLKIQSNIFIIGYVGRLSEEKNCKSLIVALSKLTFPYKCIIVGDGDQKGNLLNLVQSLDIAQKVEFVGYQENIVKIFAQIDLLVVPSLRESFGLQLLEAQFLGVNTIYSNIPAFNEISIIKSGFHTFSPLDTDEIAKKITFYYSHKPFDEKFNTAKFKNNSLDNYYFELCELYTSIINKSL